MVTASFLGSPGKFNDVRRFKEGFMGSYWVWKGCFSRLQKHSGGLKFIIEELQRFLGRFKRSF